MMEVPIGTSEKLPRGKVEGERKIAPVLAGRGPICKTGGTQKRRFSPPESEPNLSLVKPQKISIVVVVFNLSTTFDSMST